MSYIGEEQNTLPVVVMQSIRELSRLSTDLTGINIVFTMAVHMLANVITTIREIKKYVGGRSSVV
jgi:hypothetical protein